jgi:hypothetical protein
MFLYIIKKIVCDVDHNLILMLKVLFDLLFVKNFLLHIKLISGYWRTIFI